MAKSDAVTAMYYNFNRLRRYSILPNSTLEEIVEASLPEYMAKPEYQGWEEGEVVADIISRMSLQSAKYSVAYSKLRADLIQAPDLSGYGDCSYEEILNMADNGVIIPEDILEWARAMANEDSINYEIDDTASDDTALLTDMQYDLSDDKTLASKASVQKYSIKAEAQNELLEKQTDEINTQNAKAVYNQDKLEQEENESSVKIEKYNKELQQLEQKANNGETLTSNEQMRYKAIAGLINDENSLIIAKSSNVQNEIDALLNSMGETNSLISLNQQISEQLQLKNETFVSQETKSNSGVLPIINKSLIGSTNFYLTKALSGTLYSNMTIVSQNILINTENAKLNVMHAGSTVNEINQDVTNIENNFTNTDINTGTNLTEPNEENSTETDSKNVTSETVDQANTENKPDVTSETVDSTETFDQTNTENKPDVTSETVDSTETFDQTTTENKPDVTSETVDSTETSDYTTTENKLAVTSGSEEQTNKTISDTELQTSENPENNIENTLDVENEFNNDETYIQDETSEQNPDTSPNDDKVVKETAISVNNKAVKSTQKPVQKPENIENKAIKKFNFSSKLAELSSKTTAQKSSSAIKPDYLQSANNNSDNIAAISDSDLNTNENTENTTNNNANPQTNEKDVEAQGNSAQVTANTAQSRSQEAIKDKAANTSKSRVHTSKLKQNENKINTITKENTQIQAQAKILNDNTNQISAASTELAETPENNNINQNEIETLQAKNTEELQKTQNDSTDLSTKLKKNAQDVQKLQKDSTNDSKNITQTANIEEAAETTDLASTEQNAQSHVTLSEKILDIKDIFTKTKIAGLALMLSPWTHAVGVTMSNIGRSGENVSTIANGFVQLAHGNLISTGLNIAAVLTGLNVLETDSSTSNEKVDKAVTQANEANNKAENEFPEDEVTTAQNIETVPTEDSIPENTDDQQQTPTINAQNNTKEDKEPLEITSTDITEETDISVNDISLETDDTEIAQEYNQEIQQLTTKTINDSRAEYLKNPLINYDSVSTGEEISSEIEQEAVDAMAQKSAKESNQRSVKESVKEVMQSSLSNINQKAQSKDTNKDKKYKLFTQFEREKQDAMRKAVQKVNRARDAR